MNQQDPVAPWGKAEPLMPSPIVPPQRAGSVSLETQLIAAHGEAHDLREALAASKAREQALAQDVQHRVKNILAVIRSIYRRSRESGASQDEFAEHFEGRFGAVARYHSHVDNAASSGVEIEDMLRNELLESLCLDSPKCFLSGPAVSLHGKPAELMGLVIHELATNSIKFGALAQGGKLAVTWSVDSGGNGPLLDFHWVESGVSVAASAPRRSGFGRQLIEEALPYQLDATTSFALKPGGIDCSISLPLPSRTMPPNPLIEGSETMAPILPFEPE